VTQPAIYNELAPWYHLFTSPHDSDYRDEAAYILALLRQHVAGPLGTLLELGSGGGNVAMYLKADLRLTLTDVSQPMLDVSRTINAECEHVAGDMRSMRLDRAWDAVLAHDAVSYLATARDVGAAVLTAWKHLRPGGAALFMPDFVRETFREGTDTGGHDGPGLAQGRPDRAVRYLEWTHDADPTDDTYETDYAYLLRETDGSVEVRHDRHVEGLFPKATWLRLLADVGFDAEALQDPWGRWIFVARRAAADPSISSDLRRNASPHPEAITG
jgi:SAM-dependent methyltransferase